VEIKKWWVETKMKVANIRQKLKATLPPSLLKEALIAFSFNVFGVLAGFTFASYLNVFQLSTWVIALYPSVLTGRGVVNGVLSGRLGTALHLGTIKPQFRENTERFYMLFRSVIVITLQTGILLGLASIFFGSLFWGITSTDYCNIFLIIMATMSIGVVTSLVTIEVAFFSFRKAWDPDVVVYPVMSTIADVVMTLCFVLVLNLFFQFGFFGKIAVALFGLTLVIATLGILPKYVHDKQFTKTIKETLSTLLIIAIIVNVTGTVLKQISETIGSKKEVYIVYPALIDTVGDVGSVVGSTATTKLVLGLVDPVFSSIRKHTPRILATWGASLIMFMVYAFLSLLVQASPLNSGFLSLTLLLLTTNIIAVFIIVIISFALAIATFRKGLDPDNFVIPIESSLADGITTVALLAALFLIGY
jgi:mgtE-like transporter